MPYQEFLLLLWIYSLNRVILIPVNEVFPRDFVFFVKNFFINLFMKFIWQNISKRVWKRLDRRVKRILLLINFVSESIRFYSWFSLVLLIFLLLIYIWSALRNIYHLNIDRFEPIRPHNSWKLFNFSLFFAFLLFYLAKIYVRIIIRNI